MMDTYYSISRRSITAHNVIKSEDSHLEGISACVSFTVEWSKYVGNMSVNITSSRCRDPRKV